MVLSAHDKELVRERIKKQIEALKAKTKPTTPPKEEVVEKEEKT
jgi:DNA invertase Pin-like site-specific DNA recombinase